MKTNDVLLRNVTKVVVFIIFLFSLHLFLAGHYNPGGGFVAGLISAGAVTLTLIAYDSQTVRSMLNINPIMMTGVGLLFAVGTGMIGILAGDPFLTHKFGHVDLPIIGDTSLHTATIFDLGVYLVVVGVTLTIIQTIGESD
ncbi:Na(+)/H(+) antiporter subunit B [Listeria newyorkensis]|uniref:Na(+)/H(+) antiporter subunit B n=1 Tax=Listeria newyorkensis TaxID=1497681 RepID=A0A841Z045_9LIST|nr:MULTISPECIES: Na(+)/H(+) antiporter subunit B [Listeria]KGL46750.1 monovalent cation/H+ antiporter subunit B [Listeriaceae bacterium FSL A5-0209]KGL37506.1 monovalent cation/H+ antiporter subunit B [Listeria newyorkensis]KMT62035.1 Na+ H+ antiporter subunit B [Listeria newyorkensis]MBC1459040.1 Na(+)/H(+) antiporter subunit B [Listeria newyorkensis]PNP92162.1 Na(+)/H(+) antiporter subunit B [Listeria newyorkensis]